MFAAPIAAALLMAKSIKRAITAGGNIRPVRIDARLRNSPVAQLEGL